MRISYREAQTLALGAVKKVETERIPLENCFGRVLAEDLVAAENVPAFDRSPYDGYAFRAEDTKEASERRPVTLKILEEIAAGGISHVPVTPGTAVRIMTGAPIPPGADAVCKYEDTEFTESEVTLRFPAGPGDNIIYAGEDVKRGTVLAKAGTRIDAGLMGILAAQNRVCPNVYRVPVIAFLASGSELVEPGDELAPGKIYSTNRYTIGSEIASRGCRMDYRGIVRDDLDELSAALGEAAGECDAVVLTGGASVGKYDYSRQAMERAGAEILFDGLSMKPGMACIYGVLRGTLIAGLSGNPAAALTSFYAVAVPVLKKLGGLSDYRPEMIPLVLKDPFPKKSPSARFLRGTLDLSDGAAGIRISKDQGNVVLRSAIGVNVMAVVPAGSGPLEAGTVLEGFLL